MSCFWVAGRIVSKFGWILMVVHCRQPFTGQVKPIRQLLLAGVSVRWSFPANCCISGGGVCAWTPCWPKCVQQAAAVSPPHLRCQEKLLEMTKYEENNILLASILWPFCIIDNKVLLFCDNIYFGQNLLRFHFKIRICFIGQVSFHVVSTQSIKMIKVTVSSTQGKEIIEICKSSTTTVSSRSTEHNLWQVG